MFVYDTNKVTPLWTGSIVSRFLWLGYELRIETEHSIILSVMPKDPIHIKIWISSLPYSFICPDWKLLRMKKGHKWIKWPRSTWVMKRMAKETKKAAGLSENPDGEVSHLVTCWMLFREKLMNVRLLHLLNTRKIRMSKEHHLIEPNHLIPLLGLFSIML